MLATRNFIYMDLNSPPYNIPQPLCILKPQNVSITAEIRNALLILSYLFLE